MVIKTSLKEVRFFENRMFASYGNSLEVAEQAGINRQLFRGLATPVSKYKKGSIVTIGTSLSPSVLKQEVDIDSVELVKMEDLTVSLGNGYYEVTDDLLERHLTVMFLTRTNIDGIEIDRSSVLSFLDWLTLEGGVTQLTI